MTFLAPIPALVAAAITVPALLALYLLRLRRRPVRVGSVLFWPRATEDVQANVPLRWLRPTWLLLLHLLALACLLLAFARPSLHGVAIAGDRVVIVLDASASMNAVDAGESKPRFDRAKDRARQLARDVLSAGAKSVAVVQLAARAKPLTGFSTSQSLLTSAIDSAEPTDQPGNLGAALQLVDAMANAEGDEASASAPTVFLVSDGSFEPMDDVPATISRLRFERVGAPAVPDENAAATTDNVGILRLAARRDDRDPTLLRVFAELISNNPAPVDVPLTLALDGVSIESRAVNLDKRSSVLFDLKGVQEGVLTLVIARADALACDNTASVVLAKPERPRILLVQPPTESAQHPDASTHAPTWLLGDILEELHPQELLRASPAEYPRVVAEGRDQAFDLIILDSVGPMNSTPRVPSIGLGSVPAFSTIHTAGPPVTVRPRSVFWDRGHRLMQGVPLDNLVVRESFSLTVDDTGPNPPEVIARADDHPLIVLTEQDGVRHLVVCFDLAQSNWALTPSFAIFVANAVDELTLRARSGQGTFFTTDQPVTVNAPIHGSVILEDAATRRRMIVREAGELPEPNSTAGIDTPLSVGVLPRTGVYVLKTGDPAPPRVPKAVAVNLFNEVESTLDSPSSVRVQGREVGSVQPTRVPTEVWPWFVLAALALLGVEWVVYGWQVRA